MSTKPVSIHIGIYGCRNAGKSSLINMLTEQQVSIVSKEAGTTTDPVKRSFELLDVGSVVFIDTAGFDDVDSELGRQRVEKALATLKQVDLALLVATSDVLNAYERQALDSMKDMNIPYLLVVNRKDSEVQPSVPDKSTVEVNARTGVGRDKLMLALKELALRHRRKQPSLLGDIVSKGDIVLLVTPIDSEAPEGRLILPQVNTIRDILDNSAVALVAKADEAAMLLAKQTLQPKLVITDSQLFRQMANVVPTHIPLTSFSILLARSKGNFDILIKGTSAIDDLKDGDTVLLLESCSHQTSCDDIGRVKIPKWFSAFTGKQLIFEIAAGSSQPSFSPPSYALVVQCGGCMVTPRQLANSLQPFIDAGIPVTNYGMAIAYTQGVFSRAIEVFREIK